MKKRTLWEVQKNFDSLGLSRNQAPLNYRVLSIAATTFSGIILLWIFVIYEADSAQKYMKSIYVATAATGTFLSFVSTIFITQKLFSSIEGVEEFLNESKSKSIKMDPRKFAQRVSKFNTY